jgi:hypothetical protein
LLALSDCWRPIIPSCLHQMLMSAVFVMRNCCGKLEGTISTRSTVIIALVAYSS